MMKPLQQIKVKPGDFEIIPGSDFRLYKITKEDKV